MTPLANSAAVMRPTPADMMRVVINPNSASVAALAIAVHLQSVELQQHFGFRHPHAAPLEFLATNDMEASIADVAGLECEEGFQMTYAQAVEEGRRLEAEIGDDWAELDIEY